MALKAAGQLEGDRTREIDMENMVYAFGHLQATLLLAHVESEGFGTDYPNGVNMARLELRFAM